MGHGVRGGQRVYALEHCHPNASLTGVYTCKAINVSVHSLASYPGCLPAGVDLNRGSDRRYEEARVDTVPGIAVETLQTCFDQLAAHPMAWAVHFQSNPQARPSVPMATTPALTYSNGKREEEA